MRRLILGLFLIVAVVALLQSCSDGGGPADPGAGGDEPLATAVIGAGGGVLTGGGLEVSVPSGAWNAEATLSIHATEEEAPGGDVLSDGYRVTGLPASWSEPLSLRLTCSAQPAADTRLAVGEEIFLRGVGETGRGWLLLPGANDAGDFTATLAAAEPTRDIPDGLRELHLRAVGGWREVEGAEGHVTVSYLLAQTTDVQAASLAASLEDAAETLTGLSYDISESWSLPAIVCDLPGGGARFFRFPSGPGRHWLAFDPDELTGGEGQDRLAGRALLRWVLSLYDPRGELDQARSAAPHQWWDEAVVTWAGGLFTADDAWCPPERAGNRRAPLEGIFAGAADDPLAHGKGMSALVKEMVTTGADGCLAAVQESLSEGESLIIALPAVLPEPMGDWWRRFLIDYFVGDIYDDMSATWWVSVADGTFGVEAASDTTVAWQAPVPPWGARFYLVDAAWGQAPEGQALRFGVEEAAIGVTTFTFSADEIGWLAQANPEGLLGHVLCEALDGVEHLAVAFDYEPPDQEDWDGGGATVQATAQYFLPDCDDYVSFSMDGGFQGIYHSDDGGADMTTPLHFQQYWHEVVSETDEIRGDWCERRYYSDTSWLQLRGGVELEYDVHGIFGLEFWETQSVYVTFSDVLQCTDYDSMEVRIDFMPFDSFNADDRIFRLEAAELAFQVRHLVHYHRHHPYMGTPVSWTLVDYNCLYPFEVHLSPDEYDTGEPCRTYGSVRGRSGGGIGCEVRHVSRDGAATEVPRKIEGEIPSNH